MKICEIVEKTGNYKSTKIIFGENHSNYLETQSMVDRLKPEIVYHEFAEDSETQEWANRMGYKLKQLDLSYNEKEQLAAKVGKNTELFHRIREKHMKKVIDAADPSRLTAFVIGADHVFDSDSVIFQDTSLVKISPTGQVHR